MWSHMATMMGPGRMHPASTGALEFSSIGGFGVQIFFGVGGGVTRSLPWGRGIRGGGFRRSNPEHLSMAVRSCASITICSAKRNGIPSIMGNDSPLFTFILWTPDFRIP
jgi:hypothetical protein